MDPLDYHKSSTPSSGWRNIYSDRYLVNKRLIKKVEMGQSISVWKDLWIPISRPRSAIQKTQTQFLNPSLKVEHFIEPVDLSWNLDLLHAYVYPQDVKIIKVITIS